MGKVEQMKCFESQSFSSLRNLERYPDIENPSKVKQLALMFQNILFSLPGKKKEKKKGLVYQISKAAALGFKHMPQGTCALKTECVEAELHGLQESQLDRR